MVPTECYRFREAVTERIPDRRTAASKNDRMCSTHTAAQPHALAADRESET